MSFLRSLNLMAGGRLSNNVKKKKAASGRPTHRFRLCVEQLEGRVVPSHLSDPFNMAGSTTAYYPTATPSQLSSNQLTEPYPGAGVFEAVVVNIYAFAQVYVSSPHNISSGGLHLPGMEVLASGDSSVGAYGKASVSASFTILPDQGEKVGDSVLVTAELVIDTNGSPYSNGSSSVSGNLTPANLTPQITPGSSDNYTTALMRPGRNP
jgi:hypothetical protein